MKKINLILGIGGELNLDFIKTLLSLGVREFYIGYIPDYWIEKYGYDISPNRRYSSIYQINAFKDFVFISKFLRKLGCKLYFTLNEHNYSKEGFVYVEKIIDEVNQYVDGYIIANYGLLELLKSKSKEIHISGEMCVLNDYTVDMLVENGVTRIIFPRNISLLEIEEVASYRNKNHKALELELFINDSLLYTCGLCTSFHGQENYIFCRDNDANKRTLIDYNNKNYKRKIEINGVEEIRSKKCSLCFINRFMDIGINSFKIPGRTGKQDILERVVELKQYLSKKTDYNGKIILNEYNNCKLNNCMYEL